MLLVIAGPSRTGRIFPHPSKTLLGKVNHRTYDTLTWAITMWPMITVRYTSIAIMPSTIVPGLL
jgi:hypothetical protein